MASSDVAIADGDGDGEEGAGGDGDTGSVDAGTFNEDTTR